MASIWSGWSPWVAVGPLLFGVLFLVIGVTTFSRSRRRRQTWVRRTGVVVGSRLSDGQIQSQVSFSDEQGPVTFWNRFTSSFAVDSVGRTVEVLVNPKNRTDAVIAGGPATPAIVGSAFVAFGVLALIVGGVLLAVTTR